MHVYSEVSFPALSEFYFQINVQQIAPKIVIYILPVVYSEKTE